MLNLVKKAVEYIKGITEIKPETGIILGTGLGGLINHIEQVNSINYNDIPGFSSSTVESHSGKLVFGTLGGKNIIAMQGRFHYYEGYNMKEITFPVRVMKFLGIKQLLVSNASGGLNPDFSTGDLMIICDHINLFPENPLRGVNLNEFGARFPDMNECYSAELITLAEKLSSGLNMKLKKGIYLGLQGPSLETPAEYKMLRSIGADAVGMSTIPEIIVARQMEIKCFAISVIANLGIPGKIMKVNIDDIVKEAQKAETKLSSLFKAMIPLI